MTIGRIFTAAFVASLLLSCTAGTDVGKECVLVRKDPADTDPSDGTRSIPIKEKDVVAGKDFISFGATECEDLVCVRDARVQKGPDEADAKGYCSKPCLQTNANSCLTGNDSVDKSADAFTCRPLLLDAETLAAIRQSDPEKYKQYFGDNQSEFFCAKPAEATDAGTP